MGNRSAKFISALAGSIIAGAPLAAVSQNAPSAPSAPSTASTANPAGDCLAAPKGTAPQGQHWFYRLERSTKRQCWYLRAEGGKAATTTQSASSAPQPNSAPTPSVQDAHAEYIAPQSTAPTAQPAPAAAPQAATTDADSNAQPPAVTSRWPDTPATAAVPAPPPVAPVASDAQPSAKPAISPAPVTLAAAEAPADKPTGSLQMLLLVVGGALALAGLLASIIYRFAGGRVRVHAGDRRVNWDHAEPQHDDSRAPWLNAAPAPAARAEERPRPVDFDAARPQAPQLAAFTDAIARVAAQAPSVHAETAQAEPNETESEIFDEGFEIEAAAPDLAADDSHDEAPTARDENARDEDAVDIDVITAMLERLAKEGPRLTQPSLEADLAEIAQNRRGQSAARA
ncbi:hypothetical protein [Bradyrhizobium sp. RDM4]|uniref:hypothetical protein n=1 Tax=Bradyrhizobium sp. RDM4 TaxID=3378765 RepID=UPI0038FD23F3